MKFLILTFILWSVHGFAKDECSTVWVFKANTACLRAPDTSQAPTGFDDHPVPLSTGTLKGGIRDQEKICRDLESKFNREHAALGVVATLTQPTPYTDSNDHNPLETHYNYKCATTQKTYPTKLFPAPYCPTEDTWSYQTGGSKQDLPGPGHCLSCDEFKASTPEEMVSCLDESVQILRDNAIPKRDYDIAAVALQVQRIFALRKRVDISNLESLEQINKLNDFLDWASQQVPDAGSKVQE